MPEQPAPSERPPFFKRLRSFDDFQPDEERFATPEELAHDLRQRRPPREPRDVAR